MIHFVDPIKQASLDRFAKIYNASENFGLRLRRSHAVPNGYYLFETHLRKTIGASIHSDRLQAAFGAMGEALERDTFRHLSSDFREKSFEELTRTGHHCLDPATVRIFSEDQPSSMRGETIALGRSTKVDWMWFEDGLENRRKILVPLQFGQYFQWKLPLYYCGTTSGNACGQTPDSAKLSAVLELLERDAAMFYWWTKNSPHLIDVSDAEGRLNAALDRSAQLLPKISFFHLKTDLEVTAVLAAFRGDPSRHEPLFAVAGGCHLDPVIAIEKALAELTHCLLHFRENFDSHPPIDYKLGYENTIWDFYDHVLFYGRTPMEKAYRFLFPRNPKLISYREIPDHSQSTPNKSLRAIHESLRKNGYRLYYREASTSTLRAAGLSAFRAFSPDLISIDGIHRYRQLGFQRYFSLPEKMRLKKRPKTYAGLNTFPHPFP